MEKFSKEDLEKLEDLSRVSGLLKKKRPKGMKSAVMKSNERYFRFFNYGRIIAYFFGTPVCL